MYFCSQVHRILHLVGLSLREEERRRQTDSESSDFEFTTRAEKFNILGLMEQLVGSQRIESHKHLLNWTIKKWQEVAGNKSKESYRRLSFHDLKKVKIISNICRRELQSNMNTVCCGLNFVKAYSFQRVRQFVTYCKFNS